MRPAHSVLLVASLTGLALLAPSVGNTQVLDPIRYDLGPGAMLEYGCFGPCACPVVFSGPLKGSFTFYRTDVDPLFTHYALLNIMWDYAIGNPVRTVHITGHGIYDIGGEFALTQRMVLDLTIDDPTVSPFEQHFESGLVPVRIPFPAIDIEVHSNLISCRDSVLHVLAGPNGALEVDPLVTPPLLGSPVPNPSTGVVELLFAPSVAGHARVDVFDLGGRVVATLIDADLGAAQYRLRWDGRDSRGADVGAGIYWITARMGTRIERERVVRLR